MLNKQGIFSRSKQAANVLAANSTVSTSSLVSPLTAQNRIFEQAMRPGHLAALASTTAKCLIPPVVEPVPIPEVKAAAGSRLIVGPDVKLKGAEIKDCDTLVVEGQVEATMDSRVLHIAEKGIFSGSVVSDVAEIHGNFEGELTVRTKLIIHATGKVSGKIRYGKLYIVEGGELSGDIATIKIEVAKSNNANLQLAKTVSS